MRKPFTLAARLATVALAAASVFVGSVAHADTTEGTSIFSERALLRLFRQGYTANEVGYDISWPQCPDNVPAKQFDFAIIGVTGGKAFTENKCLPQQMRWARTGDAMPEVYTNVNGLPSGWTSKECAAEDTYCQAYQYGYESAAHAVRYAKEHKANTTFWWLDVETMNRWSPDTFSNARVIAGAIEYLESTNHEVGVYSTPYQWGEIAGNYAPGLPVWTAGADDLDDAKTRCRAKYAFGGGDVKLVQYIANNFDHNYVC